MVLDGGWGLARRLIKLDGEREMSCNNFEVVASCVMKI